MTLFAWTIGLFIVAALAGIISCYLPYTLPGAAGLLDGKRVATHWEYCKRLARRFPRVRVESDPIFIRDGTTWTSAGVTAGIDQALAMVEDDVGHATAMAVARDLVVFLKRPGDHAQHSVALTLQSRDRRFDRLRIA